MPAADGQGMLQPNQKQAPVRQAGELIVVGQQFDLPLGPLALGNVADQRYGIGLPFVFEVIGIDLDREFLAVLPPVEALEDQRMLLPQIVPAERPLLPARCKDRYLPRSSPAVPRANIPGRDRFLR
jgi:hypothetical protein